MAPPLAHPGIPPNPDRGGRRSRAGQPPDTPPSWGERLRALRHLPRLFRLVWSTEPRYVVIIFLLRLARAAVPLVVLWIGKLIVDEVVAAVTRGDAPWERLGLLLGAELLVALLGEAL